MLNVQDEISRTAPIEVESKIYHDGIPIMYAFECALLELETDSSYTYTAMNYINGHRAEICRRKKPMAVNEDVNFAELIRNSNAGGASRYQIDRPVGEKLLLTKAVKSCAHGSARICKLYKRICFIASQKLIIEVDCDWVDVHFTSPIQRNAASKISRLRIITSALRIR
jgi:hypothetical protein